MKVHHVLFIAWFVVFGWWAVGQFSEYNKKRDGKK